MAENPQKKGEKGEINLLGVFEDLLKNFGSISCLRRYEAGFQGGKDIKLEAIIKKNNFLGIVGKEQLKWFFEVKNYKSKLNPEKLLMKIHQVKNFGSDIDCFCLFSPHENVTGLFEDNLTGKKLMNCPEFPFRIVLWTPSFRIKEKLQCFPKIYKRIYEKKSILSKKERDKLLKNWIKEIVEQSKEGEKIKKDFISKFRGDDPIWVPESLRDARERIKEVERGGEDAEKESTLSKKLSCGGIKNKQDILISKTNRVFSEGIRRKYQKINEGMFHRLNALRGELQIFCLKIEKDILLKNNKDEAIKFLNEFTKKVTEFKKEYGDQSLIKKLPKFYFDGQMYDITGECILSLSNNWLKNLEDLNKNE